MPTYTAAVRVKRGEGAKGWFPIRHHRSSRSRHADHVRGTRNADELIQPAPQNPTRRPSSTWTDHCTEKCSNSTDKSTCQEEALEKESLNSPSQEAQKGNCSQRWRRRQQPPSSPALCLWVPLLPCVPGSTCAQSPLTAHPVMRAAGLGHEAKSHCLAPSQPYDTIFSETQSLAQSEEAWVLRHP